MLSLLLYLRRNAAPGPRSDSNLCFVAVVLSGVKCCAILPSSGQNAQLQLCVIEYICEGADTCEDAGV